jgi:MerR family transcriptional regulator, copper efflux regulator
MPDPLRLPIVADIALPGTPKEARELMQVGDLAKESGKTVRAIHLYEELTLLHPAGRSKGRYRLYGPDALVRIRWISKLQELGFSLPELQAVLQDAPTGTAQVATERLRALYGKKLAETRQQVARLQSLEAELRESLAYLETCGDVCEPDRLMAQCRSCDLHAQKDACSHHEIPELILGFRAQNRAMEHTPTEISGLGSVRTNVASIDVSKERV